MKYLVLGGKNRSGAFGKPEIAKDDLAVAMLVDVESGACRKFVEYESPLDVTGPKDSRAVLFKAGALQGDRLYTCTETEVLVYSYPAGTLLRYLTLPCFNDLHHVRPANNGNLYVVSTGLDMVFEIDESDHVVNEWTTVDGSGWSRFDQTEDYRRWPTTKPHLSHPNFVFELGHELWVTRFRQRDALCLADQSKTIPIEIQTPHDGVVFGGRVYFTTVDGHVVVVDATTCQRTDVVSLNEIEEVDIPLGWCRGLHVVDTNRVVVGFSRIRPTKFRENIRWVKHKLGRRVNAGLRPSRIALYDLGKRRMEWECILEDVGLNTIFSIHPVQ